MQPAIIINPETLDLAFLHVRKLNIAENSSELRAIPQMGALLGKISHVWDSIEATVRKVYIYGKEMVQDAIDAMITKVDELLKEAGKQVKEVHDIILKNIQAFLKSLIENAVKLIPSAVIIGEKEFSINKISYGQKLTLGGSLKANLLEIVSITSNGEMQMSVEYTKA